MAGQPIRERIAVNIVETLKSVQGGTYNVSLKVERRKQAGNQPADLLCIVGQDDAEEFDSIPFQLERQVQVFRIIAFSIPPEGETVAPDTRLNWLADDIRKALLQDTTRGGYAIDTLVLPPEFAPDGVLVTVRCPFTMAYANPYSQS